MPLVEKMRDSMTHRGPDDAGAYLFDGGRGAFGHRRLSIVDLSPAGHQPMRGCADKDVWLTFNGEIYNHAALRARLETRGHLYQSQTDSETIIHLYEERGVDFVNEIEGDFAIALWDAQAEKLSLYRDRLGVKPLYFYHKDGKFIFASEIKAILAHPSVSADIDENVLVDYLSFVAAPAPQTLFKDIHKLPTGHRLILTRNGELTLEPYWNALPQKGIETRTEAEHVEEILRLLRDSIEKRMMSDVPFGVFLSGGVDSSANVALMSELMTRPVETFTVGYEKHEYLNELDAARRVAKMFGTNHHEIIIGETELNRFLPDLLFYLDEPLADPVCVPLYYVSKLAKDSGVTVIQTGEGADEIFSGYDKYVNYLKIYEKFWRRAARAPAPLRKALNALAQPVLETAKSKRTAIELARRFGQGEPLFWGAAIVYDEKLKKQTLSAKMKSRLNGHSSLATINKYLDDFKRFNPQADFLSEMIYVELQFRLPELLLMRIDKITMANSIETRVPFLDHRLVEYALGVPREFKVVGQTGKHILKRALEPILPHDLLYAPKRGFGAPIREWFRAGLGEFFDEHFMRSTMVSREFFDYDFIARMLGEHRRQKHDWSFQLWALLNLSIWYERWIDPK